MMFKVLTLLLSLSTTTVVFAKLSANAYLVRGSAFVLGNPTMEIGDYKTNALGYSWSTRKMTKKTPLEFGEIVIVGPSSTVSIYFSNNRRVVLGPNTKIQYLPNFQNLFEDEKIEPMLYLNSGTMRVYRGRRSDDLVVKANGIHLQGEGDYLVNSESSRIEIINFNETVKYQRLSKVKMNNFINNIQTFLRIGMELFISRIEELVTDSYDDLESLEPKNKLVYYFALGRSQVESLDGLISKGSSQKYDKQRYLFHEAPLKLKELLEVRSFINDLGRLSRFIPDKKPKAKKEDTKKAEIVKKTEAPKESKEVLHLYRLLKFTVGYGLVQGTFSNGKNLASEGPYLQLDVRPWSHTYLRLGISRGQWDVTGMDQYLGAGTPEAVTSTFDEISLGAGLRFPMWNRADVSFGAGLRGRQELVIQYPDNNSNVNRTFSIEMPVSVSLDATISFRMFYNTELFFGYTFNRLQTQIEARDLSAKYDPALNLSFGKIGLSFSTR